MVSYDLGDHRFRGFIWARCFMCFWFQTYGGFIVFLVLKVSWFQGLLGFMVSLVS